MRGLGVLGRGRGVTETSGTSLGGPVLPPGSSSSSLAGVHDCLPTLPLCQKEQSTITHLAIGALYAMNCHLSSFIGLLALWTTNLHKLSVHQNI